MKIARIEVYRVELPLKEGAYRWAGGKSVETFDSTVVRVESDEGLAGHGEVCPLGPAYLPAFAAGARAGIAELAPALLGADPLALDALDRLMERTLKGHPYVKSALDMACWDLLGQVTGLPLCTLLGGRQGEDFPLYRAISQSTPEVMAQSVGRYREFGYSRFQLKVGGDPATDIERIRAVASFLSSSDVLVIDANTGWTVHGALRVLRAVQDLDIYVEQPCATYEECRAVRRATLHPFVLDESIDGLAPLLRAHADGVADVVNLKIGKLGGLTRTRRLRDLCAALGIAMTIEDTWGSDIATAAIAHLAHSTPPELFFSATDFNSYVSRSTAEGAPRRRNGRMSASEAPGLGIEVRPEVLGEPVQVHAR
jgi:L-alanine-DL-glutamate epimerase-like enolase superfamily enzyme